MGLADLKSLAKKNDSAPKTTKASKSVHVDAEPVKEAEESWIKAENALKEAKAEKENAEEVLVNYVKPLWLNRCREMGEAQNSCGVGRIRMTFKGKSQFAAKSTLNAERLRGAFGDDEFEQYFTERDGPMRLAPEALANPDIVKELTKAITRIQKKFPDTQIIDYDSEIVPKDTLFNDWVLNNKKHQDIEAKLKLAGVKKTKVSFGIR